MTVQNLSAQASFITKDGSAIRSILDRTNAPVQNQSLAEARVPAGGRTERHYHKVAEELYFILRARARSNSMANVEWSARAMRSSYLREPGTRSWLQSRCAFSVAARRLIRTRIRISCNRKRGLTLFSALRSTSLTSPSAILEYRPLLFSASFSVSRSNRARSGHLRAEDREQRGAGRGAE